MAGFLESIPTLGEFINAFTQPDAQGKTVVGKAVTENINQPVAQFAGALPQSFANALNLPGIQNAWSNTGQNIRTNLAAGNIGGAAGASVRGMGDLAMQAVPVLNMTPNPTKAINAIGNLAGGFVGGLAGVAPDFKLPAMDPTAMEERGSKAEMAKAATVAQASPSSASPVNALGDLTKMFSGLSRRDSETLMKMVTAAPKGPSAKDVAGVKYFQNASDLYTRVASDPKATDKQKADALTQLQLSLLKFIAPGGIIPGMVADSAAE